MVKEGQLLSIPELKSKERLWEIVYIWFAPENSIDEHSP
jgi:hypothetical protein